ncbi:MAG TPA: hypothetical protein VN455_10490 [Methanotrichaceae archaeon]|nr:hypothetical protein [Methanotrichaceae archaeon]
MAVLEAGTSSMAMHEVGASSMAACQDHMGSWSGFGNQKAGHVCIMQIFALIRSAMRPKIVVQDRAPEVRSNQNYGTIVITSVPLTQGYEAGLNGAMLIWGR